MSADGLGGYQPYRAYKDSGVDWLGEIPAHWDVLKFRRLLERKRLKNGNDERPMLSLSAYRGLVFKEYDDEALIRPTEENSNYVIVKPGQLVVNPMWVINSSIGVSTISGIVSPAYRVYDVAPSMQGKYLHNLAKSSAYITQYNRYIRGLTTYDRSVREDDFLDIEAVVPPLPEQRAIAAFLDRKTAEIDTLIAKKEQLIALLQEKRAALITAAVTRGLDPDVALKDSGVEWLGEIPAHWEVVPWRYCCHISEGQVDPRDDDYASRILIAPNHIESGTGRILLLETAFEQGAISGKYVVNEGDIIYSKIRPALNKLCIANGEWLCSADMYPVTPSSDDLKTHFLKYYMLSEPFVRLMVDESMRVAMPKVNRETLAECPVIIPPRIEQDLIVSHLRRETVAIDEALGKVREGIERLQEYRTALISAAVTGKIDVRDDPIRTA